MDRWLVAAGFIVPLVVALVGAVWFLVAQNRLDRRRPTTHLFRGQGDAVTVAELLDNAAEQGDGIRLNWTEADDADTRNQPAVRPNRAGEWPTAVLPRISGLGGSSDT